MDVAAPLTQKLRSFAPRAARRILLVIISGVLAGCSGREPVPAVPAASESVSELKQKVAALRGLSFKREVSLTDEYRETGEPMLEKLFAEEYGAQSLAQISRAYKRIGLLPETADLAKAQADFFKLQLITFYDARKEAVGFAPEAVKPARALTVETVRGTGQIPAVLALTRALQEQHFQWSERLKMIAQEDRKLAFRALAQGDQLLVGLAYLDGNRQTASRAEQVQAIGRFAAELEKMAAHLPEVLRQKLVLPYREGSYFVQWARLSKGWNGVNALFENPPLSTAQILDPEKYFVQRQNPLRITPWGLMRLMRESAIIDQNLGAGLIQALLASRYSRKEVAQIAAGWTGDHLSAYPDGDNLVTAWISAWSNEKNALDFFRAYESVLERHHRLRFEHGPGQRGRSQTELPGRGLLLLEVRGALVLLLDGVALARAPGFAEEIWKDVEVDAEPAVFPFDSARGAAQSSLRSR